MRLLIFATILFIPNCLWAGELFMQSSEEMPGTDNVFVVEVFVSSTDLANVLSGTINFDAEVLELKKIQNGGSIVSFWIEKPSERQSGAVNFSGMVAGGFTSSRAKIFALEFVPKVTTTTQLNISAASLLAHDGLGTSLPLDAIPLTLITKQAHVANEEASKDSEPPESFTPIVVKQDGWLDGKAVLVFDTTDKDSGVDAYYIKEVSFSWLAPFSAWRLVTSPYVLNDQTLRSFVYLKVEDRAGNSRLVMVEPEEARANYPFWLALGLLLVIIILLKKRRGVVRN